MIEAYKAYPSDIELIESTRNLSGENRTMRHDVIIAYSVLFKDSLQKELQPFSPESSIGPFTTFTDTQTEIATVNYAQQLRQRRKRLLDPESGIPNKGSFTSYYDFLQGQKYKIFGVFLLDVDSFKEIVEADNHFGANRVLTDIIQFSEKQLHATSDGILFRLFGDELVGIVPSVTSLDDFIERCEKIRSAIGNNPFQTKENPEKKIGVTICAGISTKKGDIIEQIDEKLLKNKRRNRRNSVTSTHTGKTDPIRQAIQTEYRENWNRALSQINKSAPPYIQQTEKGLELSERQQKAQQLARTLVANPTHVIRFENLPHLLYQQDRRVKDTTLFDTMLQEEDSIRFTFGTPYFFYSLPKKCVVILKGEEILKREDLHIPRMDKGLLLKRLNPLSKIAVEIEQVNKQLYNTSNDPTSVLIDFVTQSRQRNTRFNSILREIYKEHCISRESLPSYLEEFITNSFPLYLQDEPLAKDWKTTQSPEGRLRESILPAEIQGILLEHDLYEQALQDFPESAHLFIDAGVRYTIYTKDHGNITDIHLLEAYRNFTKEETLDAYIELLKAGKSSYI